MIKKIPNSDRNVRPFQVHKQWDLTHLSSGSLEIRVIEDEPLGEFDPNLNSNVPLYRTIKKLYYTGQEISGVNQLGDRRDRLSETERILQDSGSVININPDVFGEEIKRYSLTIDDTINNVTLIDDGHSNLVYESDYSSSINELENNGETVTNVNDRESVFKLVEGYDTINITSRGNVFYQNGLIVLGNLSSPTEFSEFDLSFKSTVTIYEHEYFLEVGESEFNVSQNPSAVEYIDGVPFIKKNFQSQITGSISGSFKDYEKYSLTDPTGSYLAPYITTIGLYDDNLNMVAVAKLTKPIKNLPDYPVNFIVRFDT